MKPLLVGESNPHQSTAGAAMRFALYPEPRGASGDRLCRVIMGLDARTYLRSFDRVDPCHPKWSIVDARLAARDLVLARSDGDVLVLCGTKVAEAFGLPRDPFRIHRGLEFRDESMPMIALGKAPTFVVLPHPSALNRRWHEPDAIERARAVLRETGVL